ncbi:hypothetical protein Hanom_Chr10g00880261 [Helianthus anomalus]
MCGVKGVPHHQQCQPYHLGVVCFFRGKTSAVCGPYLQTSATEEVNQTSAVCKKKTVCFLTSASY